MLVRSSAERGLEREVDSDTRWRKNCRKGMFKWFVVVVELFYSKLHMVVVMQYFIDSL